MVAPVVALVVGAGIATGTYALVDDGDRAAEASKVIVVEAPAPNSADIPGKDESATAAAISHSAGLEPRGSKASATSTQSVHTPTAAEQLRSDPRGPGISLRNP
jgi:hypothetical protein